MGRGIDVGFGGFLIFFPVSESRNLKEVYLAQPEKNLAYNSGCSTEERALSQCRELSLSLKVLTKKCLF